MWSGSFASTKFLGKAYKLKLKLKTHKCRSCSSINSSSCTYYLRYFMSVARTVDSFNFVLQGEQAMKHQMEEKETYDEG